MQTRPPSATTTLEKHQQQRVPRIYSTRAAGARPFGWLQLLLKGKEEKNRGHGTTATKDDGRPTTASRKNWAAAFGTLSHSPSRNWRSCLREATKGGAGCQ
jgi:hypothetical protein